MKKKILSLTLALAMCLGLALPALAAEEDDISVSGLGSAVQQKNTLYEIDFFTSSLLEKQTDMVYTAEKDQKITVSYTGDNADNYIVVLCYPYAKSSVSNVQTTFIIDPVTHEFGESFEKDFKGEYFLDQYLCFLAEQPGEWTANGAEGFDPIPTGDGRYWDYAAEFNYADYSAKATAGQPLTFTLPDLGEDVICRLVFMLVAPEQDYETFTKTFYVKTEGESPAGPAQTGFTDVPEGSWFHDPVQWAVEKKITAGTSETTFSPADTCSNAQILTFLWRANGSPEPATGNPFTDISPSDYYYKAALWAAEKNLVSGTAFGANIDCTRAMTVEYLWKLAGCPAPSGGDSFADVPASADFAQAVTWAVEQNITDGTGGGMFSPDGVCTRAQIVAFLYRALER